MTFFELTLFLNSNNLIRDTGKESRVRSAGNKAALLMSYVRICAGSKCISNQRITAVRV